MSLYTITFVDGTRVAICAATSDEAIRNAQKTHGKAVASFSIDKPVEETQSSPFESLQHGGPNF
jgi:hypothetical protein